MEDPWDEDGDDELERTSWWPTAPSEPSFEARKRGEERAGETLDQELAR